MPLKCGKSSQENKWGHPEKNVQIFQKIYKMKIKPEGERFEPRASGTPG